MDAVDELIWIDHLVEPRFSHERRYAKHADYCLVYDALTPVFRSDAHHTMKILIDRGATSPPRHDLARRQPGGMLVIPGLSY
jgi:hypothetical protein